MRTAIKKNIRQNIRQPIRGTGGDTIPRFLFNGTQTGTPGDSAITKLFMNGSTEGAISCKFILSASQPGDVDPMGGGNTFLRVRGAGNDDIQHSLFGAIADHAGLGVTPGNTHDLSMTWPPEFAGSVILDGASEPATNAALAETSAFYLGRSATAGAFNGFVWDVRIYLDEAQTILINHWPMEEGSGSTFFDAVGGDDVIFGASIGDWV